MANEFVAKNGLISQNNSVVTGSLRVTAGITGSLLGTATTASYVLQAVSASYAATASFAPNYVLSSSTGSFATTGANIFTGDQQVTGSISINTDLRIQGSVNQGISNINFTAYSHVEGNNNYAGLKGYAFTGASAGVITFELGIDISGEIGNYVVIDDTTITKAYKVASSVYDTGGLNPAIIITLEDTSFVGSGKVASILTRQLTGGTEIIGYNYGHAEGESTTVTGNGAHSAGSVTTAVGRYSYAGGEYTIANSDSQTVVGRYNQLTNGQGTFVIGNGTSDLNRSNLLYASGSQVQITGSLIVSGSSTLTNIGPAIFSGSVISTSGFTGSLLGTATTASYINPTFISASAAASGFGSGGSTNTGSLLTTASVSLNTITFTKGDGSTFPITVNTGSATSSPAFPYTGSAIITGSLTITGSLNVTQGITGSLQGIATTASYVLQAVSASFATTASSINQLNQNVVVTGSFTVITGSSIKLQVTDTGVKIGNTISDVHTITGSLRVSGSVVDFYPNYSFRVNNTNASASTTTTTYRDAGNQTYNGTASWTGTTPPGTPTTHSYAWNQVGNLVTLRMNLIYGSAGSALTAVSMTLPSDCPIPASPTGLTTASDVLSYGSGILSTTRTIIAIASIGAGTAALRRNSANNGYEIAVIRNSAGYQYVYATIQYFV